MKIEWPEIIYPTRFARKGVAFSGHYYINQLARLRPLLSHDNDAEVLFELEFYMDEKAHLCRARGHLKSVLTLICQRCLQPMQQKINTPVNIAIVSDNNETDRMPAEVEPYIDMGLPVKLINFIEDELLLAMPVVALHEEEICPMAEQSEPADGKKNKPFVQLKKLLTT